MTTPVWSAEKEEIHCCHIEKVFQNILSFLFRESRRRTSRLVVKSYWLKILAKPNILD